ncbi:MAG: histidine phosphatase family protein [Pseudomonadota bacterium]
MTMIYFVRHAQASFGAENYDALSPLGRRQSGALGAALAARGFRPDMIFTGRMRRHRDTAALCMEQLAMYPEIDALRGLDEYDFIDVLKAHRAELVDMPAVKRAAAQGEDLRSLFAGALTAWTKDDAGAAYIESFAAFRARVEEALSEIARRAARRGAERVLVFSSGGPIGAMTLTLLTAPVSRFYDVTWRMANCAVTRVLLSEEGGAGSQPGDNVALHPRLVSFNDYSALETDRGLLTFI